MPTPDTRTINEQVRDFSRDFAQQKIREQASALRRLADRFDHTAEDLGRVPSAGRASFMLPAQQLIHEHATWLMNAKLDTIVQYAAEADTAAALAKAEKEGIPK